MILRRLEGLAPSRCCGPIIFMIGIKYIVLNIIKKLKIKFKNVVLKNKSLQVVPNMA